MSIATPVASFGNLEVFTNLRVTSYIDDSATPGDRTMNCLRGKNSFDVLATLTITNSLVKSTSQVVATLEVPDGLTTSILRCTPANGSFTIVAAGDPSTSGVAIVAWTLINL